jgi:serine/threonine-protein kinase
MDCERARVDAGLGVGRETTETATAVLAGVAGATAATQVLPPQQAPPRAAPPGGRRPPYDPYSDRKRRKRSFLPWLVVALLLAAFAAAGYYIYSQIDERLQEAAPVAVPNVEGLVLDRAVERLEADGFEAKVERQPSSEVDENVVIDQDPEGGAKVEQSTTVVIVVSSGLPQVDVPRVVGLQLQEATSRLSARNLEWRVREVFSEQEPGIVLRQNPIAGEQVAEGTVIELRVSKGQNLIDVPNVIGQDEGTATQTLTDAGFKVSSTAVFSDQTPGTVVAQTPNGGQAVKGSTVEIQVSQGVELVTVPGVIGLSEADAAAALQGDGFGVNVEDLAANGPEEDGIVLNQDPGEGGQVEPGSTITIYVGRFTEPEPPPAPPAPPAEPPPADQGQADQGQAGEG